MKWDYEMIIFNSEWNHFCFRKGPVKQKPGERKGRKKEEERQGKKRRKGKEVRKKEK